MKHQASEKIRFDISCECLIEESHETSSLVFFSNDKSKNTKVSSAAICLAL